MPTVTVNLNDEDKNKLFDLQVILKTDKSKVIRLAVNDLFDKLIKSTNKKKEVTNDKTKK